MYRNQTKWVCRVSNTLHWGRCFWSIEPIWKILLIYNLLIVKVTMAHCCVCLIGEVKTDQMANMQSLWTFEISLCLNLCKENRNWSTKELWAYRNEAYHLSHCIPACIFNSWMDKWLGNFSDHQTCNTVSANNDTGSVSFRSLLIYSVFEKSI